MGIPLLGIPGQEGRAADMREGRRGTKVSGDDGERRGEGVP